MPGWGEMRALDRGGQSAVQMLLPVAPLMGLEPELPGASLLHGVSKLATLDVALFRGIRISLQIVKSLPASPGGSLPATAPS